MTDPTPESAPDLAAGTRRWFSALSPRWRAMVVIGLLIGLVNVVFAGAQALTPRPSGPDSSSFATAPGGVAAYADLLARSGHPVQRLRTPPADARLDPRSTLVLLDGDILPDEDTSAIVRFVRAGGRLVTGGAPPGDIVEELGAGKPEWGGDGPGVARVLVPIAETDGVERVSADGAGGFNSAAGALPALGGDGRALMLVATVGRGRAILLADASPLQNRLLGRDDNAALGLALAGESGRPVVFAEAVHGYGEAAGIGALPRRWRWALAGLGVAGLVWLTAHVRRLGPVEEEERRVAPPRRAYVDALARSLARSKRPAEASAPVRAAARAELVRRGGLAPDADEAKIRGAADALGLSEEESAALIADAARDEEAQALRSGRALARLRAPV